MVDLMLSTYHEQRALTENNLVKWANSQGADQTPKDLVVHYEQVAGISQKQDQSQMWWWKENRKWEKFARNSSCSFKLTEAVEKFPRLSTQQQCGPIIEQPVFG